MGLDCRCAGSHCRVAELDCHFVGSSCAKMGCSWRLVGSECHAAGYECRFVGQRLELIELGQVLQYQQHEGPMPSVNLASC